MNARSVSFIFILILFFVPGVVIAQDDPGGDPDVPFDGGITVLLAAAAAYGMKKNYDGRKPN